MKNNILGKICLVTGGTNGNLHQKPSDAFGTTLDGELGARWRPLKTTATHC
jgi:hypothetical protein